MPDEVVISLAILGAQALGLLLLRIILKSVIKGMQTWFKNDVVQPLLAPTKEDVTTTMNVVNVMKGRQQTVIEQAAAHAITLARHERLLYTILGRVFQKDEMLELLAQDSGDVDREIPPPTLT